MSETNPFDRQLWRDFDWDGYLAAELLHCTTDKERDECKQVVDVIRTFSRTLIEKKGVAAIKELAEFHSTIPPQLFFEATLKLTTLANVTYRTKHEETAKLNFAIGAVIKLVVLCRAHNIEKADQILRRFMTELGNDITIPD